MTEHDELDPEPEERFGPIVWAIDPGGGLTGSAIELYWKHGDATARAGALEMDTAEIPVVPLIVRGERRRCRLCGEPVEFEDPDDPVTCYHAEDANDDGKHSAEV